MNNEVNIIITSLDALEKWMAVHHADVEEDRDIPDDAVVGIRFAATPYRHSFCSRMEEKPERQCSVDGPLMTLDLAPDSIEGPAAVSRASV